MSVDHDSIKANDLLVEGKKLSDEGKYEEAVASFDKALEIKPEFTRAWYNKGDMLQKLADEGMNIARFNFSHADYVKTKEVLDDITSLNKEGYTIATMLDTK